MTTSQGGSSGVGTLTARGLATRRRIVEAAARLVYRHGSRATSLDEIMADSNSSKSQLYHYFANKEALLHAVIEWQTGNVMQAQSPYIERLDSLAALRRWGDVLVQLSENNSGMGGCPLGSLASELAEHSESARQLLKQSFEMWEAHLKNGLNAMQRRGEFSRQTNTSDLATATLSALQGGILLAQTYRSARPVKIALDMALYYIERHMRGSGGGATAPAKRGTSTKSSIGKKA